MDHCIDCRCNFTHSDHEFTRITSALGWILIQSEAFQVFQSEVFHISDLRTLPLSTSDLAERDPQWLMSGETTTSTGGNGFQYYVSIIRLYEYTLSAVTKTAIILLVTNSLYSLQE